MCIRDRAIMLDRMFLFSYMNATFFASPRTACFGALKKVYLKALSKRFILICQVYISPVPHIRVVDIFRKWVFVMFPVYPRHSMSYHILTVRRIPSDYISKLFSELGMHERRRFSGRYETILWF